MLLSLLIACNSTAAEETTSTAAPAETSSTLASTTAPPSTSAVETTTTQAVDPATVLTQSLTASSGNYRFTSVVLVAGETITTISGIVDGVSVAADIVAGTSEVSYRRTPDGEWVTGPDGEWVALAGEPPVTPPLGAMVDVGDLTLVSGTANTGVFQGVLGPAAGSAQGVTFDLSIESGFITEIRYQIETGGQAAEVITTLSDFGRAGTVTAPEGV